MAVLKCVSGCPGDHDPFQPLFACPTCGGLVDVEHDLAALKERSAADWHRLLAERMASPHHLDRSGVWRYREWVMPDLKSRDVVSAGEGRGALVELRPLAKKLELRRVFVKQCGHTLTGSFKDLGMTVLVSMAKAMRRAGTDVRALVCASTGDTSAALAAYGAMAGIPTVVLLPAGKISPAQLVQPLASGAHVLALDGDFDACMRVVQEICALPGMFLANSKNPLRLEGQKTVAFEIARELGWSAPDWVLVPSGNLGNVGALARGFSLLRELGLTDRVPRLVACQVDAANPLYESFQRGLDALEPQTARDTHASAIRIGDPVSFPRAQRALRDTGGLVTSVSEAELLGAGARADRMGLFTCPHTAAALAGLEKLHAGGELEEGQSAVVVSTAHGLKFSEQKARFHEGSSGLGDLALPDEVAALRNAPLLLPARTDDVRACLEERLA